MPVPELRPLSAGEILDHAFGLYRHHFGTLAVIVIIVSAVPTILGIYVEAAGGFWANPVLYLLVLLLNVMLGAIGTAAAVFVLSSSYLGEPISAGEALRRAVPFLGNVIVLSILSSFLIGLGFLLIIPGFIFLAALMLSTQALVLERGSTPLKAMGRSWQLTKGFRWKVLALVVATMAIIFIPTFAAGAITAVIGAQGGIQEGLPILWYLAMVVGSLLQLLLNPLLYSVTTVAYYDLRVRKEGFDLEVLASAMELT